MVTRFWVEHVTVPIWGECNFSVLSNITSSDRSAIRVTYNQIMSFRIFQARLDVWQLSLITHLNYNFTHIFFRRNGLFKLSRIIFLRMLLFVQNKMLIKQQKLCTTSSNRSSLWIPKVSCKIGIFPIGVIELICGILKIGKIQFCRCLTA